LLHETAELGAFFLAADVWGALREDGRGDDCGRLLLPGDFEQAPAFGKALQAKAAAVPKLELLGGTDDSSDRLGGQDLAAGGLGADAGGRVDRRAEDISIFADSLSGVQADAHLDLLLRRLGAVAVRQCALHGNGTGQSAARRHKGGHEAVAERLDLPAAVRFDLLAEEFEMAADDLLSGGVALAGLKGSGADDVGEKDGDDAFGRLLGHRVRGVDEIMHRRGVGRLG